VINASTTPRQLLPDTAAFIVRELGFEGIPAWTVHATCLSFLVGLQTAAAFVTAGTYRRVLVVSAEIATGSRNWAEPESAALLGDGAAAAIVEPTPANEESEILAWSMGTWPKGIHLAQVPGAGTARHPNRADASPVDNLFTMDGPGIYKIARKRVAIVLLRLLEQARMEIGDIDLVVPHQPSGPALESLSRYGLSDDRVVNIIAEYGNCIAASVPMALATAHAERRLRRGDRVLLIGTGAGLSVAGALLRW
jgi:3-oxoacyl-[acyl-carrier-protein] synthase-3